MLYEAGELLEQRGGFSCSLSSKTLVLMKLGGRVVWIFFFIIIFFNPSSSSSVVLVPSLVFGRGFTPYDLLL